MSSKSRLAKSLVVSVAFNTAVLGAVGGSSLLQGHTTTVEEALDPRPVASYRPRPVAPILIVAPTPTPAPRGMPRAGNGKGGKAKSSILSSIAKPVALVATNATANNNRGDAKGTQGGGGKNSGDTAGTRGGSNSSNAANGKTQTGSSVGSGSSRGTESGESNGGEDGQNAGQRGGEGRDGRLETGIATGRNATSQGTAGRASDATRTAGGRKSASASNSQSASKARRVPKNSAGGSDKSGKDGSVAASRIAAATSDETKRGTQNTSKSGSNAKSGAGTGAKATVSVPVAASAVKITIAAAGQLKHKGVSAPKATKKAGKTGTGKGGNAGGAALLLASTGKSSPTKNRGSVAGKSNAIGAQSREEDSEDTALNTEEALTGKEEKTTAAPTQKAVESGKMAVKAWTLTPGQKIVLPDKLDLSMLKDLAELPVGSVTLSDEQRDQIRKMLEGQNLKQITGLDKKTLKRLVDAAREADKQTQMNDSAEDFELERKKREKKERVARTPRPSRGEAKKRDPRDQFVSMPTGMTSPFKYRPWSPAFRSRYERLTREETQAITRIAKIVGLERELAAVRGGQIPTPATPRTQESQGNAGTFAPIPGPVAGNNPTLLAQANSQETGAPNTGAANGITPAQGGVPTQGGTQQNGGLNPNRPNNSGGRVGNGAPAAGGVNGQGGVPSGAGTGAAGAPNQGNAFPSQGGTPQGGAPFTGVPAGGTRTQGGAPSQSGFPVQGGGQNNQFGGGVGFPQGGFPAQGGGQNQGTPGQDGFPSQGNASPGGGTGQGGAPQGGAVMQGGGSPNSGGFPAGGAPSGGGRAGASPAGGARAGGSPSSANSAGGRASAGGSSAGGMGAGSADGTGGGGAVGGGASVGGGGGSSTVDADFDESQREADFSDVGEGDVDLSGLLDAESIETDVTADEELKEKVSLLAGRNVTPLDPAGAPTSQGQVPQIPEHNYAQQKGIPGALILPPLPPLGSASGKNPTPRPVRRTAKAGAPRAGVEEVILVPQATQAQTKQTETRRAETRAEESRETKRGQSARPLFVRRESPKPRLAQTPTSPPVVEAPPALPFGSLSQRGNVVFVPGKGERLPLGTPSPNLESSPDATRSGQSGRQSSQGIGAKVVGPLRKTAPVAARDGSTLPNQPKTSAARRFLASVAGVLGLGRDGQEREVSAKNGRQQSGKNLDIAARPGASRAVLERVEAVAPDNSAASTEKKASNSRGVKDGSVSPLPPTPLPDSDAELGDGSGLKGEYYLGVNFEQYEFTRADKNLDLFWGTDTSPSPKLPIGGEWSVRWTGRIMPKYSERYTIFATADDGVRVWIDHKLIIDGWAPHPVTEYAADVNFEAGKQYAIRVDYFQAVSAPSAIGIYWESKSQAKEFVPQDRLFYPLAGSRDDLAKDEKPQ